MAEVPADHNKPAPVLQVDNLTVRFPVRQGVLQRTVGHVHAVENVSFSIGPGEALGLVGESGSGKTTIGRALVRLVSPTTGQVAFHGTDVLAAQGPELLRIRQQLQMVFQDPYASLNPRIRVGECLMEPLLVHKLVPNREAAHARAVELLELVGLEAEHMQRWPHAFSGGQRQRIGIARALTLNPQCLICDEPVSALDVSVQDQVINLLMDLQKKRQLSMLFIAHDLAVVGHLCQRVAVMYGGEIVEIGPSTTVLSNPLHPYTQSLLSAIPPDHPRQKRPARRAPLMPPDIDKPPYPGRHRDRFPEFAAAFADTNYGWKHVSNLDSGTASGTAKDAHASEGHYVRCSDLAVLKQLA